GTPEARALYPPQRDRPLVRHHRGAELRQRLAEQHAGHHRQARKVTRKVRLVGADELGRHAAHAGLHVKDAIEQAVREARWLVAGSLPGGMDNPFTPSVSEATAAAASAAWPRLRAWRPAAVHVRCSESSRSHR